MNALALMLKNGEWICHCTGSVLHQSQMGPILVLPESEPCPRCGKDGSPPTSSPKDAGGLPLTERGVVARVDPDTSARQRES